MRKRLMLALTASLLAGTGLPAFALQPVATPTATGTLPACPNAHGGVCLGPLAAGAYRTDAFATPITFTVPEGWANYEDLPGNFLLVPPGGSLNGVDAGTSDYIGVYQGAAAWAPACVEAPGAGPDAASIAEALSEQDGLIVSEPVPVSIGGLSGLVIDTDADPDSDAGCRVPDLPFPIVPLTIGTGPGDLAHAAWAEDGFTTRFYLLDHGPTNIVIEVSDVADSPGTYKDYEGVIESMDFDLAGE